MLACELALARVRVRVLEQRPARMQESRALTLHPRTLEILDQRGLVDRFLRRGAPVPAAHFAVLEPRLDLSRLDTRHPYTLFLPQVQTEELLEERARELAAIVAPPGDLAGVDARLVRPDGHVAWASDGSGRATRLDGLRSALARWCGHA